MRLALVFHSLEIVQQHLRERVVGIAPADSVEEHAGHDAGAGRARLLVGNPVRHRFPAGVKAVNHPRRPAAVPRADQLVLAAPAPAPNGAHERCRTVRPADRFLHLVVGRMTRVEHHAHHRHAKLVGDWLLHGLLRHVKDPEQPRPPRRPSDDRAITLGEYPPPNLRQQQSPDRQAPFLHDADNSISPGSPMRNRPAQAMALSAIASSPSAPPRATTSRDSPSTWVSAASPPRACTRRASNSWRREERASCSRKTSTRLKTGYNQTSMDQQRILDFVHADPFVPFDIRTSGGRVYSVDAPDFFARSRDGRTFTYYTEDNRIVVIDMEHVLAVELANRPAA